MEIEMGPGVVGGRTPATLTNIVVIKNRLDQTPLVQLLSSDQMEQGVV